MGNSKYLDGLSKDEYQALTEKLWTIQNHKCFICGEDIDLDVSSTNIDHIKPLVTGGKDEEYNFALTHENCNKSKQDADLEVARALASLSKIIKSAEEKHETPSLKHVLAANGGSQYDFLYKTENDRLIYTFSKVGDDTIHSTEIFTDNLSKEQTAFIQVPIQYLYHDEIINPRGINSSIGLLVKEFHKGNPQLHISLARLDEGKIKIFDGQHKAVAQIMLGTKALLCRLFLNTDVDRMIETNTTAGSKLKQIAFDKSKALNEIIHNIQLTIEEQRSLINKKMSLSDAYQSILSDSYAMNRYERLNFDKDIMAELRNGIIPLDIASLYLLLPLIKPEVENRFSIENFYALQTKIKELDEEESEDLEGEIEETDPIEIRNARFFKICEALFEYMTERTDFKVSEFIASLSDDQIYEFCGENALPQVVLSLYALQKISISDWKESEEMIVEPMGEFELSWCLSNLPDYLLDFDYFTVEKIGREFSFTVIKDDKQSRISMSDFVIEVKR